MYNHTEHKILFLFKGIYGPRHLIDVEANRSNAYDGLIPLGQPDGHFPLTVRPSEHRATDGEHFYKH
ncbi:hypothetical protein D3C76_1304670 [compost metagenome]